MNVFSKVFFTSEGKRWDFALGGLLQSFPKVGSGAKLYIHVSQSFWGP